MEVAPNFDPIFWQLGRLAGAAVMSVAMMCGMVGVSSALAHVDAKLAGSGKAWGFRLLFFGAMEALKNYVGRC